MSTFCNRGSIIRVRMKVMTTCIADHPYAPLGAITVPDRGKAVRIVSRGMGSRRAFLPLSFEVMGGAATHAHVPVPFGPHQRAAVKWYTVVYRCYPAMPWLSHGNR